MGPVRNSWIVLFSYSLVLFSCVSVAILTRQGRQKEEEQKKESGSATAAIRLPQLRHVAPLEPVWPLYTSRSPDLGSSLGLHRQSTSGRRCSYYHDCCSGYHRAPSCQPHDPGQCRPSLVLFCCLCQYTRAQLALHSALTSRV